MEKHNHTAKVETWDKVSETYSDEISDAEIEIGNELFDVFNDLCKQKEMSVVELGSGSGHLSAVIANKGIKTTLVDFSQKALDVSERLYSKQNLEGQFVCQDLFALELEDKYDIAWNSGVLEHFDDLELDDLIKSICNLKAQYYVFIVPNAESVPYLLYRYYVESKNEWIWGKEFLRTDYVNRFLKEGFRIVKTFYIGEKYTEYLLNVSLKRNFPYSECVKDSVIMDSNHALVGYIFTLDSDNHLENNVKDSIKNNDSVTLLKTNIFDLRAKLDYSADIIYAQNLRYEEKEKENNELKIKTEKTMKRRFWNLFNK